MEVYPTAWIFFLIFIFISTFIVVNLFVAVIVDSINSIKHQETKKDDESDVATQLKDLKLEIAELKALIQANTSKQD
jgi:voltage-gated sodium channel